MKTLAIGAALVGLAIYTPAFAQQRVKVGIINDGSGVYADSSGPGSVVAGRMAVEEFQAAHPHVVVEFVSADHQNKPDIATSIVRRWFDVEQVDMVADIQNSAISLAVQNLANQSKRISIVTGGVTPELYNKSCSPTGVHFAMDAYALATGPVQALQDRKKWFFMTVDLAGGHLFESEATAAVRKVGGEVVGRARHPLGSADMSSYIVNAQNLGAQTIGLANAGTDAINSIKAAHEFGLLQAGIKVAPLLFFDSDIKAVGLQLTQGMVIGTNFYWDLNDETRAFAKRFFERFKRMPTQYQASVYASVRHYLKAVAAAKTTESLAVMAKMRELPIEYFSPNTGRLRPDGRVLYDTYVMQVKTPAGSTGEWDILTPVRTIPMAEAFKPISESECPLLKKP